MSLSITSPLDFLSFFLSTFENGRAFLPSGRYEYVFTTKSAPRFVWVAEMDSGEQPVCQGGVNTFGVQLLSDGFVLIADVQTDFTEVMWQAVLENSLA
jgi:hypothetical protein